LKNNQSENILEINYYENINGVFQKAFVSVQCNCALCANNLEISVSSAPLGLIKEEAFCKRCNMKLRSKEHVLQ
jgi:hypothetical protein